MRDESSATARFVAEHIVLLGPRTHALLEIPPDQIEWTTRVLEASGWFRGPFASLRSSLTERFSIPGIRTHYVLRKKIIERETRAAIDEGFRQVVVIGAGFDVLALRLASEFPLVTFVELDHAATQNAKRLVGERYGSEVALVATDLRGYGDSSKPADGDNHDPQAVRRLMFCSFQTMLVWYVQPTSWKMRR